MGSVRSTWSAVRGRIATVCGVTSEGCSTTASDGPDTVVAMRNPAYVFDPFNGPIEREINVVDLAGH